MELKFRTDIDIEIDYDSEKPKAFEYDSRDSKTKIDYIVSIETREWGIKGITYTLNNQEIECYISLYKNESEDGDSYLFKIQIDNAETDGPERLDIELVPSMLNLTLKEIQKIDDHTFSAKASATLSF